MAQNSDNQTVQRTTLQINSPHLKHVLNEVIGTKFPGIVFNTKDVTLDFPCRVLFHYRQEIINKLSTFSPGSETFAHLLLLIDFINEHFKDTITEQRNLLKQGLISFQNLWSIFRPGCIVYGLLLGQPRAFKVRKCSYGNVDSRATLTLDVMIVDFDGSKLGERFIPRFIYDFVGVMKIDSLDTFPFQFQQDADQMRQRLVLRGRRFQDYAGMHFANYAGIAYEHNDRVDTNGRVVIDCKTHHRLSPLQIPGVTALTSDTTETEPESKRNKNRSEPESADGDEEHVDYGDVTQDTISTFGLLTEEQCLIATSTVRGFSFEQKLWLDFFIDQLSPVDWDPTCFDQLVLPDIQKNLIRALVTEHTQHKDTFDDIVKGKGRGLIFLLHGPPGSGKTLTAECVAEYFQRPLYVVSSGDLGIDPSKLDERLNRILDMAYTWNTILLVDEADVFLERRSLHEMGRNALVSIFLRVLEYYSGLLFLTSNRVSSFDEALKSRVHVPLKYHDLSATSSIRIWRSFLSKIDGDVEIDDRGYTKLGRVGLNGRQIKNVVRTASSLARYNSKKLDIDILMEVIGIQRDFERDLVSADGFDDVRDDFE